MSSEYPTFSLQSIMEYNGGSVIAMVGKDCVAIASDLRLGNQALGIASDFEKVRVLCLCSKLPAFDCVQDIPHDRPSIPRAPRTRD